MAASDLGIHPERLFSQEFNLAQSAETQETHQGPIPMSRYEYLNRLAFEVCAIVEHRGLKRHEICSFGNICRQILNR
jgi:hypothetical protein